MYLVHRSALAVYLVWLEQCVAVPISCYLITDPPFTHPPTPLTPLVSLPISQLPRTISMLVHQSLILANFAKQKNWQLEKLTKPYPSLYMYLNMIQWSQLIFSRLILQQACAVTWSQVVLFPRRESWPRGQINILDNPTHMLATRCHCLTQLIETYLIKIAYDHKLIYWWMIYDIRKSKKN